MTITATPIELTEHDEDAIRRYLNVRGYTATLSASEIMARWRDAQTGMSYTLVVELEQTEIDPDNFSLPDANQHLDMQLSRINSVRGILRKCHADNGYKPDELPKPYRSVENFDDAVNDALSYIHTGKIGRTKATRAINRKLPELTIEHDSAFGTTTDVWGYVNRFTGSDVRCVVSGIRERVEMYCRERNAIMDIQNKELSIELTQHPLAFLRLGDGWMERSCYGDDGCNSIAPACLMQTPNAYVGYLRCEGKNKPLARWFGLYDGDSRIICTNVYIHNSVFGQEQTKELIRNAIESQFNAVTPLDLSNSLDEPCEYLNGDAFGNWDTGSMRLNGETWEDEFGISCCNCGGTMCEDDALQDDCGQTWCEDCHCEQYCYSDVSSCYIERDEAVYSDHHESYILWNDAVELHDGGYVLERDAVELHDGQYALDTDDSVIELYDGQYALIDDVIELYNGEFALNNDDALVELYNGEFGIAA